jgi:hypothetical protein
MNIPCSTRQSDGSKTDKVGNKGRKEGVFEEDVSYNGYFLLQTPLFSRACLLCHQAWFL